MKKNFKNIVFTTILATSMLVSAVPAFAATTTYNFTLNESGINDDTISKRTVKDNSIQVFTVTPEVYLGVAPGQEAVFSARSCQLDNANVKSASMYHPASNNKYYYLEATYSQGPSSFGTSGKYTP